MNKWIIAGASAGVIALIGLILVFSGIGIYNSQASLKNNYEMKVKDNQSEFDNMWKKIAQVVQIPEAKKNAFKEIFSSYAQSRTSEGQGRVMAWIRESSPTIDLTSYDSAMNIIVASRDGWTMRQKELVSVAEVYNNNLVVFPKNFFLSMFGFQKIDPQIITSERTQESFKTGKDNEVDLFKK